jgi:hypothetical protein
MDAIIYAVEINDRHGVGILVQRIFPNSDRVVSIRALDIYQGEHKLGSTALKIFHPNSDRGAALERVKIALDGKQIDRVLCIPYHVHEVLTALAIQDLCGASLCTYVMDDRNLLVRDIPDDLMEELLSKSNLCLGISPEMCAIYRAKYDGEMHFAPPVLPRELINTNIPELSPETLAAKTGAMIGNVWGSKWLELLRKTTSSTGINLDWYGNTGAEWNINARSQLQADGITEKGFLPTELEVAQVLRQYPYVVVPSGTLDERDDNPPTSWLSLPSRIPFILATSNTPIIVLGSANTAAARFVTRLGIGLTANYEPISFRQAVEQITRSDIQQQFRTRATEIAPLLANNHTDEWIWQSLAAGKAIDNRFDRLVPAQLDYSSALVQSFHAIRGYREELDRYQNNLPDLTTRSQQQLYRILKKIWARLKNRG